MSRGKKKTSIIRVRLLKRKRRKVKVDPKLGGQWREKEGEGSFLPLPTFPPNNFT